MRRMPQLFASAAYTEPSGPTATALTLANVAEVAAPFALPVKYRPASRLTLPAGVTAFTAPWPAGLSATNSVPSAPTASPNGKAKPPAVPMPFAAGAAAPVPASVLTTHRGGAALGEALGEGLGVTEGDAGGTHASSVAEPPAPFTEGDVEPPKNSTSPTRAAEGPTMELPPPPPPARGLSEL